MLITYLLISIPVILNGALNFDDVVFTLNNAAVTPEGYLDVTKAPYSLDNNGGSASRNTTWLQNAIDDAHQHNLAVFFPEGTYDINNQFRLFQVESHMTKCHVLVGSALGVRPVIRVTGNNFNNTSNPKSVFHFYCSASGNGPPASELPGAAYNMVFRGIDIDLGGKAGAIGIKMQAAQGSTIQDVAVDAVGAYAGIESLSGSGAVYANILIDGGRYGFYVTTNRPMATLVGITCTGQTIKPIHFKKNLLGPLTIVGFHIEASVSPVFDLRASGDDEHLSLVDGSIEMTGAKVDVIKNQDRSLYMRNVYVKNGKKVVNNLQGVDLTDNSGGWTHIDDYSFFHINSRQLIDNNGNGNLSFSTGEYKNNVTLGTASPPPADLLSRHIWNEWTFPHFEDGNCIFVGPNDGAGNDDSAAIQSAINNANGRTVFLKKGDYNLKRSLVLKSDTKLVGVARNLTRLHCDPSWTESSYTPMIKTPINGASATCLLAWFALEMPLDQGDNITFLDWTAGRHSMVREVHFRKEINWNGVRNDIKRVQISGSGGGRWYGFFARMASEQGENAGHRLFHVANTTEPLSMYGFTLEYQESQVYMSEVRGSMNVSIYGLKHESDLHGNDDKVNRQEGPLKHTPALGIVNSQNVFVVGQSGHGQLHPNQASKGIIEVKGASSDDIELVNITGGWGGNSGFGIVRDMESGQVIKKTSSGAGHPAALYLLGNPSPVVYDPTIIPEPGPSTISYANLFDGSYSDFTNDFGGNVSSFNYNVGNVRHNNGNAGAMVTHQDGATWGDYEVRTVMRNFGGATNSWNDSPAVIFRSAGSGDYQAISINGYNNKLIYSDSGTWQAASSAGYTQTNWVYLLIRVVGNNVKVWGSTTGYPDGSGTPDIDKTNNGMPLEGSVGISNLGTNIVKWKEIYVDGI